VTGSAAVVHATKAKLKRALLPPGTKVRRLPCGIARGLRMEIDFSFQTRLYLGLYETELNRHLRALCRPGFAAFDIGGQFGYDALLMAKLTGGAVVSVECDPLSIERMKRNFAANPSLARRLAPWSAAASATTDERAGTISLDDLAERTFLPDVVKIDIEGGEARALLGSERILGERRPGVVVEVHNPGVERDCLEILRLHGYRVEVVGQRRFLADYRPALHNRWLVGRGGSPA
jgi:hypothetical protein